MKILPPRTLPPRTPTSRRHRPRPSGRWTNYRPCLRWDFGFTCAFCLLHEADLFGGQPGEGLGGTTVEHAIPRSTDPTRKNDYTNCLYACRFCNRSRSANPVRRDGARLLDPTLHAWGEHFVAADDRLRPFEDDADARYTHQAYQIDDPRKVERRQTRRELVSDRLRLLARLDSELAELLRLADVARRRDMQRFGAVLEEIRSLRIDARRALEDLKRYAAVPRDAPKTCRCSAPRDHSLPEDLERQAIEVPDAHS